MQQSNKYNIIQNIPHFNFNFFNFLVFDGTDNITGYSFIVTITTNSQCDLGEGLN